MTVTVAMLVAILGGQPYPPAGLPDTAAHRALWDQMTDELAAMAAAGIMPDIPAGAEIAP